MRTKEEIFEDIEACADRLRDLTETGWDVLKVLETYEKELETLPITEEKEEIETKTVSLNLRVYDLIEGMFAYKNIVVKVPVETTSKEVLEVFLRLFRIREV